MSKFGGNGGGGGKPEPGIPGAPNGGGGRGILPPANMAANCSGSIFAILPGIGGGGGRLPMLGIFL